jgi:hypothetical protein
LSDRALLERIVAGHLGGALLSAETLAGGYSGAGVHRVRARLQGSARYLVLKTDHVYHDRSGDEPRVYGTHPSSLGAVHALLRARGLPTYELLGCDMPSAELPVFWAAMSALGGVSVRGYGGEPDPDGFHRACGEALGALHAVTRAHDGTVDLPEPHPTPWHDAFFAAFDVVIERELVARGIDDLASSVRAFVGRHRRTWVPADRYVLSHVDGLQGHAEHRDGAWRFLGHVDLEDVVFLDARFALAGCELGAAGPVPRSFWDGYSAFAPVDPSYEAARPLLKLFYLVNWLWIDAGRAKVVETIRRHLAAA